MRGFRNRPDCANRCASSKTTTSLPSAESRNEVSFSCPRLYAATTVCSVAITTSSADEIVLTGKWPRVAETTRTSSWSLFRKVPIRLHGKLIGMIGGIGHHFEGGEVPWQGERRRAQDLLGMAPVPPWPETGRPRTHARVRAPCPPHQPPARTRPLRSNCSRARS